MALTQNVRLPPPGRPGGRIEDAGQGALLATLRAALPDREEPLLGWPATRDFVVRLRVRTREGFSPSIRSLRRWRRERRFPAHPLPGKRGVVWSTGYLVAAWVVTGGVPNDARDRAGRFRSRRARVPAASPPAPR